MPQPKDQPVDELRQKILGFPVSTFEDGSPMYLEDVFPNIVESDFADNVLELLQAECNRARIAENEWWVSYFEDGIANNDPRADTKPSTTTKIFRLRIEKHKERIAELQPTKEDDTDATS